jgi:hypothetical protein
MRKKILFLACCFLGLVAGINAQTLVVNHNTENNMNAEITTALGGTNISTIKTLQVTGSADLSLTDCHAIRDRFKTTLETLDLSGASFAWNSLPSGEANAGAFSGMKIYSVTFPANLLSIGDRAFHTCDSLRNATIPDGVISIGAYAFINCKKLSLTKLPDALTDMTPTQVFSTCSSLAISELPSGVTGTIGHQYFDGAYGNSIRSIPPGITSIGQMAFRNNWGITSITFPEGLSSLGKGAFAAVPSPITEIYFQGNTPPSIDETNLPFRTPENISVYIPAGSALAYNISPWTEMKEIIEYIPTNTNSILTNNFGVFPIPTKGTLTVSSKEPIVGKITLYDLSGRFIEQLSLNSTQSFDISHLAKGIYFLQANGETVKIIKE